MTGTAGDRLPMSIMNAGKKLQELLGRLEKSHFTGKLTLRLDRGQVASAELRNYLEASQFASAELPGAATKLEKEKGFSLKG